MSKQISMLDNPTYSAFIEKFKPKKTTDDCYTPPHVFEAVLGWVIDRYGIDPEKVDRPFWPGGDFENFKYTEGGCVVDNPPFSILTPIIDFYNENNIKYFLFAPYLTNFSSGHKCCHVISPQAIIYENGAKVDTSFVTNLDDRIIIGDVELFERLKKAEKETNEGKAPPKYRYPDNVLMASDVGYMVKHGVNFDVQGDGALFVRKMDAQTNKGKSLFGGGFMVSDEIARRRREAEDRAEQNARNEQREEKAPLVWELSEREREIIKHLGRVKND